jgi:hypothetical protein
MQTMFQLGVRAVRVTLRIAKCFAKHTTVQKEINRLHPNYLCLQAPDGNFSYSWYVGEINNDKNV